MAYPLKANVEADLTEIAAIAAEDPLKKDARKLARLVDEIARCIETVESTTYSTLSYTNSFSEGGS